uniref:Uncharacterized protein n=1 Tax=Aplanochytrium stocchinoi TaxID=215587 RepID=A0A7S3LGZ9_9STRA
MMQNSVSKRSTRTWSQDSNSALKRQRTSSFNILDENVGTPHRIASLKKRAKAKGMATPSPGRANGALAMLHFTNSFNKRELKPCRPSQTLGDILQEFIRKYGKSVQSLNVSEVSSCLGCQVEPIVDLAQILHVFGVARFNNENATLLWIGTDCIKSSIEDIVQLSQASTSTSYSHLTRKAVSIYVRHSDIHGKNKPLTLGNLLIAMHRKEDCIILDKLHNISSVLVVLGLAQAIKTENSCNEPQKYCYKWIGPKVRNTQIHLGPTHNGTPPYVFRTAFSLFQHMPPPMSGPRRFKVNSNITPIEAMIKPTVRETPQSVINMRKSSRAAVREAIRSAIQTNSGKITEKKTSSECLKPLTSQSTQNFVRISIRSNLTKTKEPTRDASGKILASRESAAKVKKTGTFTFCSAGVKPVGIDSTLSPTLFCQKHISKNKPEVKKKSSGFRSAVLLSTPELSEAKTRSAIKEHLKDATLIGKACLSEGNVPKTAPLVMDNPRVIEQTIQPMPELCDVWTKHKVEKKEENEDTFSTMSQESAGSFEILTQETATSSIFSGLKRDFSIVSNF